jgi:NAD(P)-dependent dehydrogenase (short-subunit alcohol dehydrogenase family)
MPTEPAPSPERGVALVTGAGRGIGLGAARALLRSGFAVALASLEEAPPAVAELAQEAPGRISYHRFDVAEIESHGALLARIAAEQGPLACLVNNAGVSSLVRGDMLEVTPESFDRSVAVNLRGTFFLTQAVARGFLAAEAQTRPPVRGIVTISSANTVVIGENRADYCITKAGLPMMTQLFAARLAEAGIAVYEIRPGIIETEMTAPAFERYDRLIRSGAVPMRRWGTADEVGAAVAALARGDIPFATGIHLDIGGGFQMYRV